MITEFDISKVEIQCNIGEKFGNGQSFRHSPRIRDKQVWHNEVDLYCRMPSWSILQYFWPAVIGLENQFLVFFLSGRLGQVLLFCGLWGFHLHVMLSRPFSFWWNFLCMLIEYQGTKIFQYCTCPAGQVTYNFNTPCQHMHLSFKSISNKTCNMTSSSNSSQSTCPTGWELWEESPVFSRFHS